MPITVASGDAYIVQEGQQPPDDFPVFLGNGLVDLTRVKLAEIGDVNIRLDAVFGKVTLRVTDEQPVLFDDTFTNFAGKIKGKEDVAHYIPGEPAVRIRGGTAFGLLKVKVIPAHRKQRPFCVDCFLGMGLKNGYYV
mmetsp:Transcript_25708/g.42237  ORF Transcript_25708/g.42237 Transcript_25708/m.42237 type:complete len:137 (-) Transcript_25708:488-898(-)|eukprot:CAMPEP_0184658380 /NCGR_PEP_ID=MMETSP0308-20130426/25229_1 /TAXON_ID=38269 /ORGANISM="Gloeochaete witrockiana, Strain SAG 46.84" /LENGTH=136 /DNA_ID=CAMNT_0027097331 /DNA_START=55 /DNA_END=465 /DNA_ORIENTATION=+